MTDETLRAPAAEDWPIWRRTYDSAGFSPLREIDRENVGKLELAWRAPLGAGENMASPLVYGGVMYLHTFPDTTIALDASNGAVLWSHRYTAEDEVEQEDGHRAPRRPGVRAHLRSPPARAGRARPAS